MKYTVRRQRKNARLIHHVINPDNRVIWITDDSTDANQVSDAITIETKSLHAEIARLQAENAKLREDNILASGDIRSAMLDIIELTVPFERDAFAKDANALFRVREYAKKILTIHKQESETPHANEDKRD